MNLNPFRVFLRPLLTVGGRTGGELAEATLRVPYDMKKEDIKRQLVRLFGEFQLRYPRTVPELSVTANFVLEGRTEKGSTYSIW